ncbi:response regulator transcription factor [Sorangium cellulosum]|uniref:response regulator transcription factor n=1 Tax=Sorangium cellulosum TaxID=56 RepID=UPI0005D2039D|nr:helix-turn-helix transcriptional regulator [Sorangium cellulosum]
MIERISVQGAPEALFDALAQCVPIAGGLVGSVCASFGAAVSHVVRLPDSVFEGWINTPAEHLARMLSPLRDAPPGALISDTQTITGRFREELKLFADLRAAGLGESAGYKLSTRPAGSSGAEHRFLTFALHDRQKFTARHRRLLAPLLPTVREALERIKVPLIPSQSILAQIVDEDTLGYLCVTRELRLVELNRRARMLIVRYLPDAGIEGGRGLLERFVTRALEQTRGGRTWPVMGAAGSRIEVSTMLLAKEAHAICEDIYLIRICEFAAVPAARPDEAGLIPLEETRLTAKQLTIARMLRSTGMSAKECAGELRISVRTVETHVNNIYKRLGVRSRAELTARFR